MNATLEKVEWCDKPEIRPGRYIVKRSNAHVDVIAVHGDTRTATVQQTNGTRLEFSLALLADLLEPVPAPFKLPDINTASDGEWCEANQPSGSALVAMFLSLAVAGIAAAIWMFV